MRSALRQMRRAPLRIAASTIAIALAMAAMGVFAIPSLASSTLADIAAEDRSAHLTLATTTFDPELLEGAVAAIDGVETLGVDTRGSASLTGTTSDEPVRVQRYDPDAGVDSVRVMEGRAPTAPGEVLVSPGLAPVGSTLEAESGAQAALAVVGAGQTTSSAEFDTVFADADTTGALTGIDGANTIALRLEDPTEENLEATAAELRTILATNGVALTSLPVLLPGGEHPIEGEITEVAFMIGSLGVVAGIVAMVLLASTTSALVTERTRDAAIMRALGARRRSARRELRRPAILVGVLGTVIGLPLGVLVANHVSSMVLERFAGIDAPFSVDPVVLAASAAFGILGARLVSARSARRVAKVDLTTALRDRETLTFGNRWSDRLLVRLRLGGLLSRMSWRSMARRRGRTVAMTAQFAGAVGAAVLVASLATSVADFNGAELASFEWESETTPADPAYPFPLGDRPDGEVALKTEGELDDWEIDVLGVDPLTEMIDTRVSEGSWLGEATDRIGGGSALPAVLAERFAQQEGHEIGDELTLDLAGGPATFSVVGLHPIRSVALFTPAAALAEEMNTHGSGNTLWSIGGPPVVDPQGPPTITTTREDLFAEDSAARTAILGIFGAIGVIVVSISLIGTGSTVAMNLWERRREIATLQAVGARRGDVRRVLGRELLAIGATGWVAGTLAGIAGASAIMGFFASSNAIDLGFEVAWVSLPLAALAVLVVVASFAASAARNAQRRPLEETLRATT